VVNSGRDGFVTQRRLIPDLTCSSQQVAGSSRENGIAFQGRLAAAKKEMPLVSRFRTM
jgi:hypothetical protein